MYKYVELKFLLFIISMVVGNFVVSNEKYMIITSDFSYDSSYQVYAVLAPTTEAKISSERKGVIKHVHFLPGDKFKKGDILVSFKCDDIHIELKRVHAELQATLIAKDSSNELKSLDAISDVDLSKAETEHKKKLIELEKFEYEVTKCTVYAPHNGEVVGKSINNNEIVRIGDPLIHIMNNKDLKVKMYIPSIWLNKVNINSYFTLSLQEFGGKHAIQGKVIKIVRNVDPTSQSILIYGEIKNNEGLFSGMSGVASFHSLLKSEE
jgi:membrane fusion protein, multidrug efflux system